MKYRYVFFKNKRFRYFEKVPSDHFIDRVPRHLLYFECFSIHITHKLYLINILPGTTL